MIYSETDRTKAIHMMNQMGKTREPFLFIINACSDKAIIAGLSEVKPGSILYKICDQSNYTESSSGTGIKPEIKKFPVSYNSYNQAFNTVKHHLQRGDSYLLNLTFPTPVEINYSPEEIFFRSNAKYKLWLKDRFVVFSPETFIRIENGYIRSFPMKGTIDADLPCAEQLILEDPKEKAEHYTIVDLIRNDLSLVADEIRVNRFRYIDKVTTHGKDLLQVSSEIEGKMRQGWEDRIGDVMFSLLPAGSVTGAPKKRTIEIIHSVEPYDRGYYTGVAGIFTGHSLESFVMIRFIEQTSEGLIYKSGGGITVNSDCRKEYDELIDKVYVPFV